MSDQRIRDAIDRLCLSTVRQKQALFVKARRLDALALVDEEVWAVLVTGQMLAVLPGCCSDKIGG